MSRFIPIELHHASRLLNHGPTVMITSFDEQSQRRNIMAAAWSMPVEFEPPRVAIV
ncbi:flavin reductase family protein, partial [Escherichia coli]